MSASTSAAPVVGPTGQLEGPEHVGSTLVQCRHVASGDRVDQRLSGAEVVLDRRSVVLVGVTSHLTEGHAVHSSLREQLFCRVEQSLPRVDVPHSALPAQRGSPTTLTIPQLRGSRRGSSATRDATGGSSPPPVTAEATCSGQLASSRRSDREGDVGRLDGEVDTTLDDRLRSISPRPAILGSDKGVTAWTSPASSRSTTTSSSLPTSGPTASPPSTRIGRPESSAIRPIFHFEGGVFSFEKGVEGGEPCDWWLYDDLVYPFPKLLGGRRLQRTRRDAHHLRRDPARAAGSSPSACRHGRQPHGRVDLLPEHAAPLLRSDVPRA